jgi:hypothetical protein
LKNEKTFRDSGDNGFKLRFLADFGFGKAEEKMIVFSIRAIISPDLKSAEAVFSAAFAVSACCRLEKTAKQYYITNSNQKKHSP